MYHKEAIVVHAVAELLWEGANYKEIDDECEDKCEILP